MFFKPYFLDKFYFQKKSELILNQNYGFSYEKTEATMHLFSHLATFPVIRTINNPCSMIIDAADDIINVSYGHQFYGYYQLILVLGLMVLRLNSGPYEFYQ